jgi:dTDP-4-dehydrorhamnose reductase
LVGSAKEESGNHRMVMKILITGSAGMLGTELCKVLGTENEIVGLDVVRLKASDVRFQAFYEASITDGEKIKEIFDKEKPNIVIHAAAFTDVDGSESESKKAYEVNVRGTQNIAQAASREETPVMFISTDFVFDGEKQSPYTEEDAAGPLGIYGKTKWEAEEVLRRELSHYTIVRTSWLFGKNGKNFVNTIIEKTRSGQRITVVDDQIGSPTYAKDLAGAIVRLLGTGDISGRDIFHISNSGQCSWFEFAKEILSNTKGAENTAAVPITAAELGRSARRPSFSVLDNTRFQKKTGYKMRPWQDALKDYIDNEYLH